MNIQRVVLVLLGVMLVSFGLAAAVGVFHPGGGIHYTREDIETRKTFNAEGLKRIVVETVSTRVNIIPVEEDEVTLYFQGGYRGSAAGLPELKAVKLTDSLRVNIEYRPVNLGFFSSRDVKLDIYLPQTYEGELTVQTVSGDVTVKSLDLARFRFKSVSGGLRAEDFSAEEGIYESTSGDIRVTGLKGGARANTVSGDIFLNYMGLTSDIIIQSTSGNAWIELPRGAEFELSARTVSGNVKTGFPITLEGDNRNIRGVVGSGLHRITASTVSGDVSIQPIR